MQSLQKQAYGSVITIDIGGTKVCAGLYRNEHLRDLRREAFPAFADETEIFTFICDLIEQLQQADTSIIAIGVPAIVEQQTGTILNAVNIPAWQCVALQQQLELRFSLPVLLENDVNCFTYGEHRFGAAQGNSAIIGLCLGTGVGAGLIINRQLYQGINCCAGEVGSIPYLDSTFDDYCSGRFFHIHYQQSGESLALQAKNNVPAAIDAFVQYSKHLAQAIKYLLLLIDPEKIVLGGSVAKSYELFIDSLWQQLADFPYPSMIKKLQIVPASLEESALLGAASLALQHIKET